MSKRVITLAILFIAGLYLLLQVPILFINPGQVSIGHAKIEADCFQCHEPLSGPSDEKCMVCHKPGKIESTRSDKIPFHQQLKENLCSNCHTEHLGRKAAKATRIFDHALLGMASQNACRQCHATPKDALHRNIKQECSACHSNRRWKPATFEHTKFFRFDRHHPADCASCHPDQKFDQYTCYSCHEHSPSNVRHEHWEEGIRDFNNCTACHRSGDEDEAEWMWRKLRRQGISPDSVGRAQWPLDNDGRGFRYRERNHDEEEHDDDDHD
ncbi:MAG: class III cytochrome C family protein [Magnetococcales bacterium]|nr:class III cytochrome C family protein [Magnetococcales bacterium]